MRSLIRRKLIRFGVFPLLSILLLLSLLAGSLGRGNDAAQAGWKPANQVAPPRLLEQVVRENFQPEVTINARNLKVWKIQLPKSRQALYLIDSRIGNAGTPQNQPLCGAAGCVFLAYTRVVGDHYQRVLNTYLNPLLPPDVPLIKPASELQSGLPCLLVNQLENRKIRTSKLCLNGTSYEVVESHLLPKVYE